MNQNTTIYKEIFKSVESIIGDVYMVGGSVRDIIMGKIPLDYDFCTPIHPEEVEKRIRAAGKRPYLIGKKYGTVGFKDRGQFIEITTFRHERYESNNRKPHVDYVSDLRSDLERRDFTINAIAMKVIDDKIEYIDPTGGGRDIGARLINQVGDAEERIIEDPLRMLRAARFVSVLDFDIDKKLAGKIKKNADKIYSVSKERWTSELEKLLMGTNPAKGLQVLADTELLRYILPELWLQIDYDQNTPYHRLTLWEHTKKVVSLSNNDIEMRWAALLHDVGKPFAKKKNVRGYSSYYLHNKIGAEIARDITLRLKLPKARIENIFHLVDTHMEDGNPLRKADNGAKA